MKGESFSEESATIVELRQLAGASEDNAVKYLFEHLPISAIERLDATVFNEGDVSFGAIRNVPSAEGGHFVEMCRAFLGADRDGDVPKKKEFAEIIRKYVDRKVKEVMDREA